MVDIVDTSLTSPNYFRLSTVPNNLYAGKNLLRLNANSDTLARNSSIFIEVVDSNGDPIYHEVLNYIDKDESRLIAIYIYEDTPPGEFAIYLLGTATYNQNTNQYLNPLGPNVIWTHSGIVHPFKKNESEIVYLKQPQISYKEVVKSYEDINSTANRTSSSLYSINEGVMYGYSTKPPVEFGNSVLESNTFFDSKIILYENPITGSSLSKDAKLLNLPKNKGFTILSSSSFPFNNNMLGGRFTFSAYNIEPYLPDDILDRSVYETYSSSYSASVIEVINEDTIKLYPPFEQDIFYRNKVGSYVKFKVNKFVLDSPERHQSRLDYYVPIDSVNTPKSQSLLSLEFRGLEPSVGTADSIKLKYKGVGSLGEYLDYGVFEIEDRNLLVDTSSFKVTNNFGVEEKPIGIFDSFDDFDTYWSVFRLFNVTSSFSFSNKPLFNSIKTAYTASNNLANNEAVVFELNSFYAFEAEPDTQYVLEFDSYSKPDSRSQNKTQIDVYISGSSIIRKNIPITNSADNLIDFNSIVTSNPNYIGTYLGSTTAQKAIKKESKYYFITKQRKKIIPKFVFRNEETSITNIKIKPLNTLGYSPNHYKLLIPVEQIKRNTEYLFKVDYLSPKGSKANIYSQFYGVVFNGGNYFIGGNDNVLSGSFHGDGSGLTNLPGFTGISIQDSGSSVESSVSTLNFFGSGVAINSTTPETVDINILGLTGSFVGDMSFNNSNMELTASISSNTTEGLISKFTAGEDLGFGDVCFYSSSMKIFKADATNTNKNPAFGLVKQNMSVNTSNKVLIRGIMNNSSWNFNPGDVLYLSTTNGGIQNYAPTGSGEVVQTLGISLDSNTILFNPSLDKIIN